MPNMALTYSLGFFVEFISVFQVKLFQINTENDRNLKNFLIFYFMQYFMQDFMQFLIVSTDFVDWNVSRGQRGIG